MTVSIAPVWSFSALLLIMIICAFYFAIFYMIFYIMGVPLRYFLKRIAQFLNF